MPSKNLWPKDIPSARKLQDVLRKKVKIIPLKKPPMFIAAVDASFADEKVIAVATLYNYSDLSQIQRASSRENICFPYIPGFLSFREGHAAVTAIKKLKTKPDVILCDGQGIAHPKGIGIASHLGVVLNIPTIGCAKSRLTGKFEEPDKDKGSWTYLYYKGKRVGVVLRTRNNVKPVFVSPGHMTDIKSSVEIVMNCLTEYRIPEPLRRADQLSRKLKNE